MNLRGFALIACTLVLAFAGSASATAETAAEFYKGKVVKLVVGYGAGGGYDTYARMLAPHLEERLSATVVVENRPGGGGMVAISQLASSSGDGLTMVLANLEAAALGQVLDSPGIRFDLTDLPVLARVSGEPKVLLLSNVSPFRSIADLQAADRPIRWSGGGKTDGIADVAAVLSQALGLNSSIIIGYKGAKESALAAIRGEVDGLFTSAGTAPKLAQTAELSAVAVMDRQRTSFFPDLPTIFELVMLNEEQEWWIDYRAGLTALGRTLLTAPAVPASRIAFLREAVTQVMTDPAVIAEAKAKRRPLAFERHDRIETLVRQAVAALDQDDVGRLREVILKKYY